MAADEVPNPRHVAVDTILASWRQGDCVLAEQWFVARVDVDHPLSAAAQAAASEAVDLAEDGVRGLVVVTQTCDIVRSCLERPFLEVCPLVEVDDARLEEIARARRPAYAYLPALVKERLVADLDRTMTVEKPVVAKWIRTAGCTSDAEGRAFAQSLSRKRARFAFPDDFTALTKKLQGRLVGKHAKETDEGCGLRALREIRVLATPAWGAETVNVMFWFIRDGSDATFEGKNWADLKKEWLKLVPASGRYAAIEGVVVTLDEMSGAEYVASDPLDLDHLSSSAVEE